MVLPLGLMLLSGCKDNLTQSNVSCIPVGQIPSRIVMSTEVGEYINKAPASTEFDTWLIQIANQQDQLGLIKGE